MCKSSFTRFEALVEYPNDVHGVLKNGNTDSLLPFRLSENRLSRHGCEEGTPYSHVSRNHRVDTVIWCNVCGKKISWYTLRRRVTSYHEATFKYRFCDLILGNGPRKVSLEFKKHRERICECQREFGKKISEKRSCVREKQARRSREASLRILFEGLREPLPFEKTPVDAFEGEKVQMLLCDAGFSTVAHCNSILWFAKPLEISNAGMS
ncbi:hypothetical protein EVAR_23389_1 [Eumeta japonica]|uniref:Uncharacterized protein n=1 Tax=Eumeta variegata TaxID=151549 RepID=A0A4C1VVF4_EUMVA|nr:hypothetical protein EVAR_23389_1 [Eumeta japonica]